MSFRLAFQSFFWGIVFTLVAIVVIFLKVLDRVEKKYAVRRAAYDSLPQLHPMLFLRCALIMRSLEEKNRQFLSEVNKRKETLSISAAKGDSAKERELCV